MGIFNLLKPLAMGVAAKGGGKAAIPKLKDLFKTGKSKNKGKVDAPDAPSGKGGPGLTKLAGAGYLGSKLAGDGNDGSNQESMIEGGGTSTPSGLGALGGLSPTGMMGSLGIGAGLFGGGTVQTTPETVSLAPGKSVLEQILGVLVKIKQDTSSLIGAAEQDAEAKGRAMESLQAAKAEQKVEGSRLNLSSIGKGISAIPSGIQKGLGLLGKGLATLFAADVLRKIFLGEGEAKADEMKPPSAMGKPETVIDPKTGKPVPKKDAGILAKSLSFLSIDDDVANLFEGIKQTIFAGTPGPYADKKVTEGIKKFMDGVGGLFDELLNPVTFLEFIAPETFGGGKLDSLKLKNAMNYLFGKPGEESAFVKDMIGLGKTVTEAFTPNEKVKQEFKTIKDSIVGFGDNIKETTEAFVEDSKKAVENMFDTIGQAFQDIKNFFKLDNLKKFLPDFVAKRIGSKEEVPLKPDEEISQEKLKKDREEVIAKTLNENMGGKKEILGAKIPKTQKSYDELTPNEKSVVDKRVEDKQRAEMKKEGLDVVPKQRSQMEKDPFSNQIGNQMRYNGADPKPMVMAMNQVSSPSVTEIKTENRKDETNVNIKNEGGGNSGNIGTRNNDTTIYNGISTPPAHTSSYY